MKRPKSKTFKRRKDLIKTAVNSVGQRSAEEVAKDVEEAAKDAAWVQENRLVLEINARHNKEVIPSEI